MINKVYKAFINSWVLLPCIPFYVAVFNWDSNIPRWDDYDGILAWIMKFSDGSILDKISLFLSQYGEHRLIPSKILYLTYYYLTGGINFRGLMIIGNLQLLVVAFASIYFLRKYTAHWRFLSFIWTLCIFDLNTYENASMALNATANYGQF